jgi:hypothetical protein
MALRQRHQHLSEDRRLMSFLAFISAPMMFRLMAGLSTNTFNLNTRHMMPTPGLHRWLMCLSYPGHRCPLTCPRKQDRHRETLTTPKLDMASPAGAALSDYVTLRGHDEEDRAEGEGPTPNEAPFPFSSRDVPVVSRPHVPTFNQPSHADAIQGYFDHSQTCHGQSCRCMDCVVGDSVTLAPTGSPLRGSGSRRGSYSKRGSLSFFISGLWSCAIGSDHPPIPNDLPSSAYPRPYSRTLDSINL